MALKSPHWGRGMGMSLSMAKYEDVLRGIAVPCQQASVPRAAEVPRADRSRARIHASWQRRRTPPSEVLAAARLGARLLIADGVERSRLTG